MGHLGPRALVEAKHEEGHSSPQNAEFKPAEFKPAEEEENYSKYSECDEASAK